MKRSIHTFTVGVGVRIGVITRTATNINGVASYILEVAVVVI